LPNKFDISEIIARVCASERDCDTPPEALFMIARFLGVHDTERLRALLLNLQRAMWLPDEIQSASPDVANLQALLDVIDRPAILVNSNAHVLLVNGRAEALFREGSLVAPRRQLGASRADETAALRALIGSTATGRALSGSGRLVVSRPDAAALVLRVAPLAGARLHRQDQLAIVFVNDPVCRPTEPIDLDLLRDQFHLTKAEAEIVAALLSGLPLKAASRPGASVATARTHLSRVFQKTGAHSQTELVNLLRKSGYDG
jgi:DNA-binding CsgD family transcriptional regulator